MFVKNEQFWNLTLIFIERKKGNCELLFIWIQAHHNEKLVYAPTNIVRSSKFVCNIATKRFIGWGKNGELLSWSLQTTS